MNSSMPRRAGGGSNGAAYATTKERVAMAADWEVAEAIPDRLYTLYGRWMVEYWEADVLKPLPFERLESFARDLGTLADARAIPEDAAWAVLDAFLKALAGRSYPLPDDYREIARRWFELGRGQDAYDLIHEMNDLGDRHHRPTPPRPICRHCGADQ